uniref:Condensin complex subunit 2 n=1 Tax=Picea sitchensis TaxID=3332 RepID=D5A927_PICSI|nr:unknown [Picea sitchensis]
MMCIGKKGRKISDLSIERGNNQEASSTWDGEDCQDGFVGEWDDGQDSDVVDPNASDLVTQPRKVQKIDVDYDRTSKEVDVRILKETLWERIQDFSIISEEDYGERSESAVSFKRLLNSFPARCAAAAPENISVHLCFICLLHLANENSLKIQDCSSLDELSISNIQNFWEAKD